MRQHAETIFNSMFDAAQKIAEKVDIKLVIPRFVQRQKNRDNYEEYPQTYFRWSIFVPFLDHFLEQLQSRFIEYHELLSKIQNILPSKCLKLDREEIRMTIEIFEKEWPNDIKGSVDDFVAEIITWQR